MLKIFKWLCCSGLLTATILGGGPNLAAERPTFQHTRDPRPDILPYYLYYAHTQYRREYNRPRFLTGWLATKIAPSSQEAMVWYENYQDGAYDQKHSPPRYKRYFAPKPWEVLQTGARPDTPKQPEPLRGEAVQMAPAENAVESAPPLDSATPN